MKSALIVLVVLSLIVISTGLNTQCMAWNKSQEWRCAKDNAPADQIQVVSTCGGCSVNFKIGAWISQCGKPGVNEFTTFDTVGTTPKQYSFPAASSGICREFFIFDCSIGNTHARCPDVLRVRPV